MGTEDIEKMLGYVSEGMKKIADLCKGKAPIADYNFGGEGASLSTQLYSYAISGFIGIFIVSVLVYVISKLLGKGERFNTQFEITTSKVLLGYGTDSTPVHITS